MATRKNSHENMEAGLILGGLLGMEAWADIVAQEAGTSMHMPVDTATLSQSIIKDPKGAQIERNGGTITFSHRVGSGLEYAPAQEMGSGLYHEWDDGRPRRAYAIVAGALQDPPMPGGKKALAFEWPNAPAGMEPTGKGGKFLFTYVMHPGVRAKRFLRNANRDKRERGIALVRNSMMAAMAKMSR
ncbi:MAG: hypothetical protein ACW99J_18725 [Candidatus Thorarchaeota archaeon]|jgi:hypothetical protein